MVFLSGYCCADNSRRHCEPSAAIQSQCRYCSTASALEPAGHCCADFFSPFYRRPGEGRDPVAEPIRLDPGLRRDDNSMGIPGRGYDQSYRRNNGDNANKISYSSKQTATVLTDMGLSKMHLIDTPDMAGA
jgi:hypothetical protein